MQTFALKIIPRGVQRELHEDYTLTKVGSFYPPRPRSLPRVGRKLQKTRSSEDHL